MASLLAVISKLLGFAREAAMAAVFGASASTDAYFVAQNIPTVLFSVVGSALTAVAVPVFVEYRSGGKHHEFERLVWSSGNLVLLGSALLSAVGILFAEPLTRLVAPGFASEAVATAKSLAQIMMFLIMFQALSGWATGVLNAHQHFLAPAAVGLPLNMICILGILLASTNQNIHLVAWATLIGGASQFFIQIPPLHRQLQHYRWLLDFSHPGLRKMARLGVPVIVGVSCNQVNILIDRMLASGLEPGSISALSYAQRVLQLPYGLLAAPILMVLYPSLANYASSEDWVGLRRALNRGLTSLALLFVPVTVGMLVLRVPLIRFLFERGAFDSSDTARTSIAFLFYGSSLLFIVWRDYLIRVCYVMNDSRTPMWTALVSTLLNIVLNLVLVGRYGIAALAFATALASMIASLLLLVRVRYSLESIDGSRLLLEFIKIAASSAVMGLVLIAVRTADPLGLLNLAAGNGAMANFIRLGLGIILSSLLGGLLFTVVGLLMRIQDMQYVRTFAQHLFRRCSW